MTLAIGQPQKSKQFIVIQIFLFCQNSKPKLFDKKPVYHSNFTYQVLIDKNNMLQVSQIALRPSSHYQSSSIIHNLSQNVSHSPTSTHKQSRVYRPPTSKLINQKDSSVKQFSCQQLAKQQKLSSILSFMTSKPDYKKNKQTVQNNQIVDHQRRKSGAEIEGSELETTKFVRKNQSMSDLPLTLSKTPNPSPLEMNQIKNKASFLATTQKIKRTNQKPNINSNQEIMIDKIKIKIKKLFKEREQSPNDEQSNLDFNLKFNCLMLQMAQLILSENQIQPPSSQDSISNLHLDHAFKQQIQIVQQFFSIKNERNNLDQQLNQQLKKVDNLIKENNQLNKQIQDLNKDKDLLLKDLQKQIVEKENLMGEIKKIKITLEKLQLKEFNKQTSTIDQNQSVKQDHNDERNELKYLIQGQFEAIQKLLQREQLVKVFLKKIGDSQILIMFEQFIQDAEQINSNDTEGNLHAHVMKTIKMDESLKEEIDKIHNEEVVEFGNHLLKQYEESYQNVNLSDSQMADNSRVNDSEESSFRYLGKEEATEISQWLDTAPELKDQSHQQKTVILPKSLKEKLKINIQDLALNQLNQFEQKNQKDSKLKIKNLKDSSDSKKKKIDQQQKNQSNQLIG